jgi:hypothetical protein
MLHDALPTTGTIISAVVPEILISVTHRPVTYVQTYVTHGFKIHLEQDVKGVKLIKLSWNLNYLIN